MLLKQSTAVVLSFGPLVSNSDGVTLVTGSSTAMDNATSGIKLSKNGGALAARHATVTATSYDAYGQYLVTLDTTDTNTLGALRVIYQAAASNLPVWVDFQVVPANVYDSMVLGSDLLDANASQLGGTNQTGRDVGASVLLSSGTGTGQVTLASGKVTIITADQTAIAGATWDVTLSGHLTSGSTGAALNAAGSSGDPWATALPGAYGSGTAGKIVGDNINATISSRLASASYTAPDNADITAIKAKTDNLPAAPAAVGDIPTANQNADAMLKRDFTAVSGEANFSALNALRSLRFATNTGSVLNVYKENGSTLAWSAPITTDSLALPVTAVTP